MDPSKQVYEQEATGWQRGLYDDIRATFRAPIINWIFRTLMANRPGFLRYVWGQVSPIFRTAGFARFSVTYRDAVLSAVEDDFQLPSYRREDLDVSPAEYRELRGQIATFDIVSARLAAFFDVLYRGLHDEPVGNDPAADRPATAPYPDWLDADRGRSPTLVPATDVPADAADAVDEFLRVHGIDEGVPSIYRCLAQWPTLLAAQWTDLGPVLESSAFTRACDRVDELTDSFVTAVPYRPRLSPTDLRGLGMTDDEIEPLVELIAEFRYGGVQTVLPALPVYAASVDAAGARSVP